MPKMFGFSRRRMKLGRLKSHLGDPAHGARSPARPIKRLSQSNEDVITPSVSGRSDDLFNLNSSALEGSENWSLLCTEGEKPSPRFNHAAAVIGGKMVIVGGDSGHRLLDDTRILSLDKLTWAAPSPKIYISPSGRSSKIPACKGHCLVPWGKMVLLIGGKTEPASDRLSVWSFDIESECWSQLEAKGDIPAARSGHTVIRAGPVLILFGGENSRGKKLNDLHMFDLKSSTWLPLRYKGSGPSPRSNHVAALYDDKILLVFGGQSKSKTLNDLYSLDFETMVWSRVKTRGSNPSPRAGCCGALCGTKWYISGGGSKKKRRAETVVLDVLKFEWSSCVIPPSSSITTNKGFSMVPLYHRDKIYLIAFGGNRKEPSDKVEILVLFQNEHVMSWGSAPDPNILLFQEYPPNNNDNNNNINNMRARQYSFDSIARHSLASAVEQESSGRKSFSDPLIPIPIANSGIVNGNGNGNGNGNVSLRRQFHQEEECSLAHKLQRSIDDDKYKEGSSVRSTSFSAKEKRNKLPETSLHTDIARILSHSEEISIHTTEGLNSSQIYQIYETKILNLTKKNSLLEEQLKSSVESKEMIEKELNLAIKNKEEMESKLEDALKEVVLLKEKISGLEIAQDEANNLSNEVHSDNVRLEHDVAFLKAILDDTQKELHSTRGVLAGERARAFQLQVEVFHLKQRLQSVENRAPTPRKPYNL